MISTPANKGAVQEYTEWLGSSLSKYEALAKSLVSHKAEKGRIVESVVKDALRSILPSRYSLGTGFIVTAHGQSSSQIDIVIYDGLDNKPLTLEGGTGLFPIESVYGFVEVKTRLDAKAIKDSARAIGAVRGFAAAKRYAGYEVYDDGKGNRIAVHGERLPEKPPLPPRSFIFAIDSALSDIASVEEKLRHSTETEHAHVHGLAVLKKDWFVGQIPFEKTPHQFVRREGRSFAMFCATVLATIQSMQVQPAAMTRYFGLI